MLYLLVYIIKHTTDEMFYLKFPVRSKVAGQKWPIKSGRPSKKVIEDMAADLIRDNLCYVGYVVRVRLLKTVTRCFLKVTGPKVTGYLRYYFIGNFNFIKFSQVHRSLLIRFWYKITESVQRGAKVTRHLLLNSRTEWMKPIDKV